MQVLHNNYRYVHKNTNRTFCVKNICHALIVFDLFLCILNLPSTKSRRDVNCSETSRFLAACFKLM